MKIIVAVIITIVTSLFYFPFNTSLLPSVNTKMALAVLGLVILGFEATQNRYAKVDKGLVSVTLWSVLVSFMSLAAAFINDSGDYTYASYVVTAWVWLGGAYTVVKCLDYAYGKATLRLLTNYLIAVCVCQCILSQIIDSNASVAQWVDSFMVSTGFMGKAEGRLYGLGCALDVAGLKFCAVLLLLSYFMLHPSGRINKKLETGLYLVSFWIIGMFGAMISRTTSIGIIISVVYWIFYTVYSNYNKTEDRSEIKHFWSLLFVIALIAVPVVVYRYHNNAAFAEDMRFGFEGFFSLVESGRWEVRSNSQLMGMWVWPDNIRTWIIGDGYFNDANLNPYYIGPSSGDYYMGTDIGYCRFVFYFGLIGLLTFCGFFINCARVCSENYPKCKIIFWLILLVNFIGWTKVSSDIFPIFALVLMLGKAQEMDENEVYKEDETNVSMSDQVGDEEIGGGILR